MAIALRSFMKNATALEVLLYLQLAYAIWQFIRVAKFCRLPYLAISSCWHGGFSTVFRRNAEHYWVLSEKDVNTEMEPVPDAPAGCEVTNEGDGLYTLCYRNVNMVVNTKQKNQMLKYFSEMENTIHNMIPLLPDIHLCDKATEAMVIKHVLKGKLLDSFTGKVVIDKTSKDGLNINFMRILSILPLTLQAKHQDSFSAIASVLLILLDMWSIPANKLWQRFKANFQYYTKLLVSVLPPKPRAIMFHLLSTGSLGFMYCDKYEKRVYFTKQKYLFLTDSHVNNFDFNHRRLTFKEFAQKIMRPLALPFVGSTIQYSWLGHDLVVEVLPGNALMPLNIFQGNTHKVTYRGDIFHIYCSDHQLEMFMHSFYYFLEDSGSMCFSAIHDKIVHHDVIFKHMEYTIWKFIIYELETPIWFYVSEHAITCSYWLV